MKNVRRLFLVILVGVVTTLASTQVFAADPVVDNWDEPFENAVDFTQNTTNETPAVQNQIEETQNNVVENKNVNNVTNKNTNKNSSYNNSNLPKTGAEDVLPIAALVVVFGVSALFAYKKVSDYKNL